MKILPRPMPPSFLLDSIKPAFHPDADLYEFSKRLFLDEDSKYYNDHHSHLLLAKVGFLWTNISCVKQMKDIAATAQMPKIQGNRWNKAIFDFQMANWFGDEPLDFLITIDANHAEVMEDNTFFALIEHEFYHCAWKGFNRVTQLPTFQMRDHDVTEFIGITERYGPSVSAGVPELIEAAKKKPLFSPAECSAVCGNCMGLAA